MAFGGNATKSVYDAVAFGGDTIASRDDAAFGSNVIVFLSKAQLLRVIP